MISKRSVTLEEKNNKKNCYAGCLSVSSVHVQLLRFRQRQIMWVKKKERWGHHMGPIGKGSFQDFSIAWCCVDY